VAATATVSMRAVVAALGLALLSVGGRVEAITITFGPQEAGEPQGLAALPDRGRSGFTSRYTEKGMTFGDVVPRDPLVGSLSLGTANLLFLTYENIAQHRLYDQNPPTPQFPFGRGQPDPASLGRRLQTLPAVVGRTTPTIQLTYDDPRVPGTLNFFTLRSLDVRIGTLNIGVCRALTLPCPPSGLAVYNNLVGGTLEPDGPGLRYTLGGGANENIIRATLEPLPTREAIVQVDNIVFDPAEPPPLGAPVPAAVPIPGETFFVDPEEIRLSIQLGLLDDTGAAVPEPTTLALLGTALLILGGAAWRRARRGRRD
jgi:PEP-CTERM motif